MAIKTFLKGPKEVSSFYKGEAMGDFISSYIFVIKIIKFYLNYYA